MLSKPSLVVIINTLKNIGYLENNNLFIFPYDWRQSIDETKNDLKKFLQTKIWNSKPNQKVCEEKYFTNFFIPTLT